MKKVFWVILIILSACASKKQVTEFESQPSWMKQKPIIPGYFIGIGSAKKVGTANEYISKARKDALADLAGEVSSQINSTSVYHTIENKYGHIESFDQRIETTVSDYLEGFEPVDQYETSDSYWVYFRISKNAYYDQKEKKKKETIDAALAKYVSGIEQEKKYRIKEALSFYLQGLQILKPYLKEETPVEINGEKMDLGNRLFSASEQLLNQLFIRAEKKEITLKRGQSPDSALKFRITYNGEPIQGIPVEFSYSGGYLKKDRQNSDVLGFVYLEPEPVYSKNKQEKYVAGINLREIVQKAVEDVFIRGLALKHKMEPAETAVNIEMPLLGLVVAEKSCIENECEKLKNLFSQQALIESYQYSGNTGEYIFRLSYDLLSPKSTGDLVSTELTATIELSGTTGQQIWSKNIQGIKGVGKSVSESRARAFDELLQALGRNYIKQGLEKISPIY